VVLVCFTPHSSTVSTRTPGHEDFDQTPLLLPRHRLVEPLPQLRKKRLCGVDVLGYGVGPRDPASQLGNLYLQLSI
jgi:hypothetical protein